MRIILTAVIMLCFLFSASFVNEASAAAKKAPAEGGGGGFEYVELDPLMLPIVDDNGVSQTINLVIALEVKDVSTAEKVKILQPKLTDAFIMDMYGVLNRHAAMQGGVLQVSIIKDRLNKVSDEIMGDADSVHDVLLQVVQQRPI